MNYAPLDTVRFNKESRIFSKKITVIISALVIAASIGLFYYLLPDNQKKTTKVAKVPVTTAVVTLPAVKKKTINRTLYPLPEITADRTIQDKQTAFFVTVQGTTKVEVTDSRGKKTAVYASDALDTTTTVESTESLTNSSETAGLIKSQGMTVRKLPAENARLIILPLTQEYTISYIQEGTPVKIQIVYGYDEKIDTFMTIEYNDLFFELGTIGEFQLTPNGLYGMITKFPGEKDFSQEVRPSEDLHEDQTSGTPTSIFLPDR